MRANHLRHAEVARFLQAFIRAQHVANAHVTLSQIARQECEPYRVHPELLTFFRKERQCILDILQAELDLSFPRREGIVDLFVALTKEYIYQNNQFITLSPADQWKLAGLYLEFVADLAENLSHASQAAEIEEQFREAMERHLDALHVFTLSLANEHGYKDSSLIHRRVTCEEYSADLQLNVLGIDVSQLAEPILDIGCGKRAELVHHLRRAGLEAVGMDRLVQPGPYLVEGDWLQARFEPLSWGTIISHMAFSNHFRFHHLYRHGIPEVYATKFVEILSSLKRGGTLYYTPGLPFIETLLPVGYRVSKKSLEMAEWAEAELTGGEQQSAVEDSLYTTMITRIAEELP